MIKVILKEDVVGQGRKNDVVEVSDGFARNFLLPKNKAITATPEALKKIEEEKSQSLQKEENIKKRNLELKEKIEKIEISLRKKSKDGKLFGGITAKEIAEAYAEKGLDIDYKKIIINKAIKSIGSHTISIALDKNIRADINISVAKDN